LLPVSTPAFYVMRNRPFRAHEFGHMNSKRRRAAGISVALLGLMACHPAAPGPADDPWIPSAADVELISIQHYVLDARGDVVGAGSATQIDPRDNPRILQLLSAHSGQYAYDIEKRSTQQCSIAIDGKGIMLAMVRVGADWIDVIDVRHMASDGYTLIARSRALDVPEQIALAQLCERERPDQMELPIQ
jgi:hypothetical protein